MDNRELSVLWELNHIRANSGPSGCSPISRFWRNCSARLNPHHRWRLSFSEQLKFGLLTETKGWRLHYGKACNHKYHNEMESTFTFIDDIGKRLSRPIKDLDDIRIAMAALKEIREKEIKTDMSIGPIEESYAMLQKHDLPVPREEMERVDTLRYVPPSKLNICRPLHSQQESWTMTRPESTES